MNNVLVTGENRGIGLAFVSAYLQRGKRVIATCRQPSQASELHELQQTYGEAIIILPMDVTDPQQIAACQAEVAKRVDTLHLLINNAGIFERPRNSLKLKCTTCWRVSRSTQPAR